MSGFKPTDEQLRVLDYSGKNLIVSASAGSGKTSTLVEFVARKIAEGQPVKRIMLLTFTKAAANEMKERLVQKLVSLPENEYVLEALDDISTADISTIHSFLERVIKRNLNFVELDEGFKVLSEDEIKMIKTQAFEEGEKTLKAQNPEGFEELYIRLHNDRELIFEIIESMSSFFATQANADEKIERFKNSQNEFFDEAISYIVKKYSVKSEEVAQKLEIIASRFEQEKYKNYCEELVKTFSLGHNKFEGLKNISNSTFKSPSSSKDCDEILLCELKEIYKMAKQIRDDINAFDFEGEQYSENPHGKLEKALYEFFEIYKKTYSDKKMQQNAVDFNDLERFADIILQKDEIALEIQDAYDYIFVDEYQDTNRVQEKLIKTIAMKSNFVAVGDPKQSIYGFRNATSEIIKEDIKDFSENENSSAEFLRQNFRSDGKILNFVNNVFENVMTNESVGIDYKGTSMLESGKEFLRDKSLPVVRIDQVIAKNEEEKSEKEYDIMSDLKLKVSSKNLQAKVIALRIQELMLKQIYDDRLGGLRNVEYGDIAILTRGKGEFVCELMKQLAEKEIPVVSEIKGDFKTSPEILVIINLFKIMLDFKDDVSLLSVMLSKFGGFTVDEVSLLRLLSNEKEFFNIIKNSHDEKVVQFLNKIERLRFDFEVNGAYIMLENLINECDYRMYLLSKENGQNEMFLLGKFLEQLKNSPWQYDLPMLVEFLKKDSLNYMGGGNGANAVSICTIHSSKGLEFPIVILADMGRALLQPFKKDYILNEKYGLALKFFSRENDEVLLSPTFYMLKEIERKKNLTDENMLLYVAMTRAKNHLYIVGQSSEKTDVETVKSPLEAKTYLEMIFSSYKKLQNGSLKDESVEVNKITEIEEVFKKHEKRVSLSDKNIVQKIRDYFDFKYPYEDATKMIYKNSVSALNEEHKQIQIVGHDNDEFIEMGNAYHLALKEIDFEKVNTLADVEEQLSEHAELKDVERLIDNEILYKNIEIIKKLLKNSKKVYKEQQFTSLINLSKLGLSQFDEEVMVQGIVDLFAIGEENILIDYKFSNATSDESFKKRYSSQLLLYKESIENAFKIKIDKIYLLSLKNSKIINF